MKLDFVNEVKQKTNEDLLQMFINSDDYQPDFIIAVTDELKSRGVDLNQAEQEKTKTQDEKDQLLSIGRKGNKAYIILGFISALLGGILGIVAGYVYSQSKHKSSPRNEYYVYDDDTRKYGLGMMVTGIVVFVYLLTTID